MIRWARAVLVIALTASATSGCNAVERSPSQKVVVAAGSHMQRPFQKIGEQFKAANPGVIVDFHFGFSPAFFSTVMLTDRRVDVLAMGDPAAMKQAEQAGLFDGTPVVYASTMLTIAVAQGNPKNITSLRDLTRPDLKVAVCAKELEAPNKHSLMRNLPCGAALEKVEQAAGVQLPNAITLSRSPGVLEKVLDGDVDAGVVYASDAAASAVTAVPIPEAVDAVINYSIAVLKGSRNLDVAHDFVDTVTGSGRAIFKEDGFDIPG